jgi:hypothetical protein
MTKNDLITKLELLLDIDDVKDFDYDDDLVLWGKKEKDDEGNFIWGEIIAKDDEDFFSEVLFGFAYDKNTDLDKLSDYIIGELAQ